MNKAEYNEIEGYMLEHMQDAAHDKYHVYRVLNSAIDIACHMEDIDNDVLIAACLLHDIGREKQFANPEICHAQAGADMAYEFLLSRRWQEQKASHVKDCIFTHRYRKDNTPQTMEAKVLFDADKLEAGGAMGIARTLMYKGQLANPLYDTDDDGLIITSSENNASNSFFGEYNFKLKKIYGAFLTDRAREIAMKRQKTAVDFYNGLLDEITENYDNGIANHPELLSVE